MDPEYLFSLQNHRQSVNFTDFSPDSQYIASASDDKTVNIYSLHDTNIFYKIQGHKDIVTAVKLASNYMVTASKDSYARLWKTDQLDDGIYPKKESLCYRDHIGTIRSVDISSDEQEICTASDDKTVRLWSPNSNRCISKLCDGHNNWIRCAKFSKISSFKYIASCGDDGIINIWDARMKYVSAVLKLKTRSLHFTSLDWNPQHENIIASGSTDSCVRVWDLRTNEPMQAYHAHQNSVSSVDFHESGKYLLSSSTDSAWKIFHIFKGIHLFTGKTNIGSLNHAKFSPNGKTFATSGKEIMLWASHLPGSEASANSDRDLNPFAQSDEEFEHIDCSSESQDGDRLSENNSSENNTDTNSCAIESLPDSNAGNIPNEKGPDLHPHCNCMEFLREILTQVGQITDSIIELDKRLGRIEKSK